MNLHPLGERVLIKRKDIEKVGNIYIPKNSQEAKASLGEVVSVGPDCVFLEPGDVITFGRYAPLIILKEELKYYGIEVELEEDMTYLLLNEADVLCIISDEAPTRNNDPWEDLEATEEE